MMRVAAYILAAVLAVLAGPAVAHELHQGTQHVSYQSWINRDGKGCCNDRDCRPIADRDVQLSPMVMVRIDGAWCPVLPIHYLRQGNAPDWQSYHVCIAGGTASPCERLLCFQPKPMF